MQYVELEVVRYAAGMLAAAEEAGHTLVCEKTPGDQAGGLCFPAICRAF